LHKHTQDDDLQFFICYSSLTAALGNIGQSAYGAANRYLDLLAGIKYMPLSLSLQIPAVDSVGMAVASKHSISHNHMISALDFCLVLDSFMTSAFTTSVIVSIFPSSLAQNLFGERATRVSFSLSLAEVLDTVYKYAKELVQGNEEFSFDDTLMEVGLDSLGSTDLVTRLSNEFSLSLPSTFIFNYPSVNAIGSFLFKECSNQSTDPILNELLLDNFKQADRNEEEVAIVGLDFLLPGDMTNMADVWQNLRGGIVATGGIPVEKWDSDALIAAISEAEVGGSLQSSRYGGIFPLEPFASMGNPSLGISETEQDKMDLGQRLMVAATINALHDAGLTVEKVRGKNIGVFVAASAVMNADIPREEIIGVLVSRRAMDSGQGVSSFEATGYALSVASGRISYLLGLHGPCSSIDAACASFMVAMHQARRSILNGECPMAIVPTVNVLNPVSSLASSYVGMLSPDGQCHTFDESANGYCRAEGCGAVVLKRLSDAERDG
ncbi:KR domain-containing protein, partial [archaeon]